MKNDIEKLKKIFPSYPKTPYLGEKTAESLDIFVNWNQILEHLKSSDRFSLLIQEKMDGANAGMMLKQDNLGSAGEIYVRNRDHILRKNYIVNKDSAAKTQFLPFFNEAHARKKSLAKLNGEFGQVVAVYGEWMYAVHSTIYDTLPAQFMAFDIWLTEHKKFVDPLIALWMFEKYQFSTPSFLRKESSVTQGDIESMVMQTFNQCREKQWKSDYGEKAEGFYVKVGYNNEVIQRFKMVRPDYTSNLYWNEKSGDKAKNYLIT